MHKFLNILSGYFLEEKKYFQGLVNSFDGPVLICDFRGKILFINKTLKNDYNEKLILIEEMLSKSQLDKMSLGSDLKHAFSCDSFCLYNIYKLLNNTESFQEDLYIMVFQKL